MNILNLLAIDLGAESGRAVLGRFDGERLAIEELHRLPNDPVRFASGLHWNAHLLFAEIKRPINVACNERIQLHGFGVDTWGVDYGLLDRAGDLIGLPVHYRNARVDGVVERAQTLVRKEDLYAATGCQTIPLNTVYQLLAHQADREFERAERMMLMPDLMNYRLTGEIAAEQTIASTTQLYDPVARDWAWPVIDQLGLPSKLFQPIESPGTIRGRLKSEIASESGAEPDLPVIAIGSHGTASAFAAVAAGAKALVIASGTWSLTGIETAEPIITQQAMNANFTNEAGICGTNRFLKNIAGMWLIQECRRTWSSEGQPVSYDDLTLLAAASPAGDATIDPEDPVFVAPGNMPDRIRRYCIDTGQMPPSHKGAVVRCILESLALKYRGMVELVERVSGRRMQAVHIIGGGARNTLHCQLAADATGLPVYAGPIEATAIGNLMMQAMALGAVGSLNEIREVIARSFAQNLYTPVL